MDELVLRLTLVDESKLEISGADESVLELNESAITGLSMSAKQFVVVQKRKFPKIDP